MLNPRVPLPTPSNQEVGGDRGFKRKNSDNELYLLLSALKIVKSYQDSLAHQEKKNVPKTMENLPKVKRARGKNPKYGVYSSDTKLTRMYKVNISSSKVLELIEESKPRTVSPVRTRVERCKYSRKKTIQEVTSSWLLKGMIKNTLKQLDEGIFSKKERELEESKMISQKSSNSDLNENIFLASTKVDEGVIPTQAQTTERIVTNSSPRSAGFGYFLMKNKKPRRVEFERFTNYLLNRKDPYLEIMNSSTRNKSKQLLKGVLNHSSSSVFKNTTRLRKISRSYNRNPYDLGNNNIQRNRSKYWT